MSLTIGFLPAHSSRIDWISAAVGGANRTARSTPSTTSPGPEGVLSQATGRIPLLTMAVPRMAQRIMNSVSHSEQGHEVRNFEVAQTSRGCDRIPCRRYNGCLHQR